LVGWGIGGDVGSPFGRNVLAEGLSERRKSDGSITIKIQVRLLKQKYQVEEEQDELYVNAPSECEREGVKEAGNSSLFKGRPAEGMPDLLRFPTSAAPPLLDSICPAMAFLRTRMQAMWKETTPRLRRVLAFTIVGAVRWS
jgi:hypothetical protein